MVIGNLPVSRLAPLDYRYALDAAMATLAHVTPILVHCREPALWAEVCQRIPPLSAPDQPASALWIEPQSADWTADLANLTAILGPAARLSIIASRPLARLLPERQEWNRLSPLGLAADSRGGEGGPFSEAEANSHSPLRAASSVSCLQGGSGKPGLRSGSSESNLTHFPHPLPRPATGEGAIVPLRSASCALGLIPGGIGRLRGTLERSGFTVDEYGVHSIVAIALNLLAQRLDDWGRPELGDRFRVAARLHYCPSARLAPLSTVALLIAQKESGRCC